jgi:hypothetical protein
MGDYEDYPAYEPEEPEQEPRRDPKVQDAKIALERFFEQHHAEVFYERQLEIILEKDFFHWITRKALYELHDEGHLSLEKAQLNDAVSIKFYRRKNNRFWRRQANEIARLVRAFSDPSFTRALGQHGELMFDAALPTAGFMPKGKNVRTYAAKEWTATGHNLDRVFQRDGVTIDWTVKESVRAKLRAMVKRILRKYGYPPDKQEKATQTVLEQAELLCRDWAA